MIKALKFNKFWIALVLVVLGVQALLANQAETGKTDGGKRNPEATQAPVPAQILTAKKAFVAYGGSERDHRHLSYSGSIDRTYQEFYAALKTWGNYQLVSTPAEADLVFEVSFSNPHPNEVDPHLNVAIIDLKTHVVLWTITEEVEAANLQANRDKNFDRAIAALVNDIARLAGKPPSGTPSASKQDSKEQGVNE